MRAQRRVTGLSTMPMQQLAWVSADGQLGVRCISAHGKTDDITALLSLSPSPPLSLPWLDFLDVHVEGRGQVVAFKPDLEAHIFPLKAPADPPVPLPPPTESPC